MVWSTTQSTLYGNGEQHCPDPPRAVPPQEKCTRSAERRRNDPVSAFFGDRDALLIAAVIFLLMNEKADMKLILALVFVLLG